MRQNVEHLHAFIDPIFRNRSAKNDFVPRIVFLRIELKCRALFQGLDGPSREHAREFGHVVLGVTPIHA